MKTTILVSLTALTLAPMALAQGCVGDIVADNRVDGADLGTLLAYWGPRTSATFSIASDLKNDGRIDGADLGILLANWGVCLPSPPSWATVIQFQVDPAVVTDVNLRNAISATGLPWRVNDAASGMEMLLVPPGTFRMGCGQEPPQEGCLWNEVPSHIVTLTHAFYLGRFEVTQADWIAVMGTNPSWFTAANGYPGSNSRPVDRVSWYSIQGFLAATSMRLPTEAEWEFACRAGTTTALYNGSEDLTTLPAISWCAYNSNSETHPVGSLAANRLGFHDMLGNVWEWVNDWYGPYSAAEQIDPTGPFASENGTLRGGGWGHTAGSDDRFGNWRSSAFNLFGFRVARNP